MPPGTRTMSTAFWIVSVPVAWDSGVTQTVQSQPWSPSSAGGGLRQSLAPSGKVTTASRQKWCSTPRGGSSTSSSTEASTVRAANTQ